MKKVILLMLLACLFVGCKGEADNGEPGIPNGTPVTLNLKLKITNNQAYVGDEYGVTQTAVWDMYIYYFNEDNSVHYKAAGGYTHPGDSKTITNTISNFPYGAVIKSIGFQDFGPGPGSIEPKLFYIYGKPEGCRGLETQLSTEMVTDFLYHEKLLDFTWNVDGSVTLNNE